MERKMSVIAAIMMNINIMIGAGIFLLPPLMAQKAGVLSYLGWPLVALLFLPVVFSIAQVTSLFPEQGSFYNYSQKTMGPLAGFISGLVYFLGYVSVIGLQTHGLRHILIYQFGFTMLTQHALLFNAAFFGLICALNFLSLRIVACIQNASVLFKLSPIFIALVCTPFLWNVDLPFFSLSKCANVLMTMPIALFGYWGFESCASISHLIEGDKRNASRAIFAGFVITMTIYTLFHLGLLHIMGVDALTTEGVAGFAHYLDVGMPFLGKFVSILISVSICVALMSAVFGEFISNSALIHAMAEENLFFASPAIAQTTSGGLPWAALCVQAGSAFLITTLIDNQFVLNAMSNFGILAAFFLTLVSLFLIQKNNGQLFAVLMTLLAFVSCGILTFYSWALVGEDTASRLANCVPLLTFVGVGVVMYLLNRRKVA